ncbi:MAG: hypothetical protein FWD01_05115, partial [Defluviitaleaceae bacterium]|nr:hypothetical protein [Defluviitaleaceae bacterium]
MSCAICGSLNNEDAIFCQKCGHLVSKSDEAPKISEIMPNSNDTRPVALPPPPPMPPPYPNPHFGSPPATKQFNARRVLVPIIIAIVAFRLIMLFFVNFALIVSRDSYSSTRYVTSRPTISMPVPINTIFVGESQWVDYATIFAFTPTQSGIYTIFTQGAESTPYLTVTDQWGNWVAEGGNSGGVLDVFLSTYLNAWETYHISVRFFGNDSGWYSLNVTQEFATPSSIDYRITESVTIPFTPPQSGIWEFYTHSRISGDPLLRITDQWGNWIAEDDDTGGDFNAFISVYLNAWETYNIHAGFFSGNWGDYTLSIVSPGFNFIYSGGGTVDVNNRTMFEFSPAVSGFWEFRTFDNFNSDPHLILTALDGSIWVEDDDSGDGLNSPI